MYLLDTCVLSELVKPYPEKSVVDWVESCEEEFMFLSVLTLGELHKGIAKLPDSKKKRELHAWVETKLRERFRGRILDVTDEVATIWGKVQAEAEAKGQIMPVIDSLIAATAITSNFTVVTRNVDDMAPSGVNIINPWETGN